MHIVVITIVHCKLTCFSRFRWNEEGCKDAFVVSSVPTSASRSYFEIGELMSQ